MSAFRTCKVISVMFVLLFLFFNAVQAQIRLPSFFSDHMVLQRETNVKIWGWARAGSTVKITTSWSADTVTTITTGDAKWSAFIKSPKAGGPFKLTFFTDQKDTVELNDVLIGEVWLCSGQSNMQWNGGNNLKQILDELPNANHPKIRLLQVSNIASASPQDNIFNSWMKCSPENVASFSAIGYFIAKKLNTELDVPIGIINSSWGGTAADFWTAAEWIEKDPGLLAYSKLQKVAPRKPYQPGVLWNTMIYPLVGYNIAGAFWYQGEDNRVSWQGYNKLMGTMIQGWRAAWKNDFPFYFVQIAPYNYKSKDEPKASLVREQQAKTALTVPNTAMVVTTDLVPDVNNIHPTKKKEVADRLADIALTEHYKRSRTDYKSPIYKSYVIKGNQLIIDFNYLEGKLVVKGDKIIDLFIAGEDKIFYPAEHKIDDNKLIVYSRLVKKPMAVRFGFTEISMPNLFNSTGLPVSPFRTDDWGF